MLRKRLTVALLLGLLFAVPAIAGFGYDTSRELSVGEKDRLETAIGDYGARIHELDLDMLRLRGDREWVTVKILRARDQGRMVPHSLLAAQRRAEEKLQYSQMEKERLQTMIGEHVASLKALDGEVRLSAGGKAPVWWALAPGISGLPEAARALQKKPLAKQAGEKKAAPKSSSLRKEVAYKVRTTGIEDWVALKFKGDILTLETRLPILFGSGKTGIAKEYRRFFKKLAGVLKPYPVRVEVEGFADRTRARGKKGSANMELGARRAASVVSEMVKYGIDPSRFTIKSRGEYGLTSRKKKDPMMRRAQVTVFFAKDSTRG